MPNPVQDFFDARAAHWDDYADDDLSFVRTLFERIPVRKGDRILDCACGTGVVTGLLQSMSGADVLGIDLSPKMIEIAKAKYAGHERVSFRAVDFYSLEEKGFDLVVIYNAYPHFVEVGRLKEKLAEVLTDGGRFAIVHSLGRAKLCGHHNGLSSNISRDLKPAEEEAKAFLDKFQISVSDEGEDFYLVVGEKRRTEI